MVDVGYIWDTFNYSLKPSTKMKRAANFSKLKAAPDQLASSIKTNLITPEDSLGQRLVEARKRAGVKTLVHFHKLTKAADPLGRGVARTAILEYERGNTKPGARELRILSDVLRITPTFLIYGTNTPFEPCRPTGLLSDRSDAGVAAVLTELLASIGGDERQAWLTVIESVLIAKLGFARVNAIAHTEVGAEWGMLPLNVESNIPQGKIPIKISGPHTKA